MLKKHALRIGEWATLLRDVRKGAAMGGFLFERKDWDDE
jgi:hypothetical protein